MVELRPWRIEDAAWYADTAANDELIQRFTTESPHVTEADVRAAILELAAGAPGWVGCLIADERTGERLGNIALRHEDGVGHLSYWLAAPARGRGAATAAVRLMCARAFGELGLREVRLWAYADNVRSRAVAERAGFRRDPDHDRPGEVAYTLDG